MKVAHVGNTANNAYLNAKFLRRLDVEADAYYASADFGMGHPEWEYADFEGETDPYNPPDWSTVRFTNGYARPEWAMSIDGEARPAGSADAAVGAAKRRISKSLTGLLYGHRRDPLSKAALSLLLTARKAYVGVKSLRADRRAARRDAAELLAAVRGELAGAGIDVDIGVGDLLGFRFVAECRELAARYDIVQLYGSEATKGPLLGPEARYVTFEHGTMRLLPFADTREGRLLAESYRRAPAALITNADCLRAAERLGLPPARFRFIPHPVDEDKYTPAETPLRAELQERFDAEHIFLLPTRHDWEWLRGDSKRVDKALRAFVRFTAERPKSLLILCEWGHEVAKSKRFLSENDVADRVLWTKPVPKMRLLAMYRASDAVLDQFSESIGSFGALTAEALSCGKPVITYLDRAIHDRCFVEQPPTLDALAEDEILERMRRVVSDPAFARKVSEDSRRWVEEHHGWRLVGERLRSVYERVLAGDDLADMEERV